MLEEDFNLGLAGASVPHVRFPIYSNNVSQALIGALRVRYPIVEQLVGQAFFSAMAGAYVAGCKPTSAVLIYYGGSFVDFISDFEPARSLAYLPDVAKLESAWWQSYHAFEAQPLDASVLAAFAPEELGLLKFKFHPSTQLLHNLHGAATIWHWHQTANNAEEIGTLGEEFTLISRPHASIDVRNIEADAYLFLELLVSGNSLEVAFTETVSKHPEFDLQKIIAAMFQLEIIMGVFK